jgi:hypothetical protein
MQFKMSCTAVTNRLLKIVQAKWFGIVQINLNFVRFFVVLCLLFFLSSSQDLAKRLIMQRYASIDAENSMISKLKTGLIFFSLFSFSSTAVDK